MPKLTEDALAERREAIEDAALRLFRERGFHAVGLRDICREGGVSLGNVYNHFASKEEVFRSLLARKKQAFRNDLARAPFFASPDFPADIEATGFAIRDLVKKHEDYLLLIFVDVVEFQGKHIAAHYEGFVDTVRLALGDHFARQQKRGALGTVDPALGFGAVYMQFFNYFMIKHIFGVKDHFGGNDATVVSKLARIFREGLLPRKEGS